MRGKDRTLKSDDSCILNPEIPKSQNGLTEQPKVPSPIRDFGISGFKMQESSDFKVLKARLRCLLVGVAGLLCMGAIASGQAQRPEIPGVTVEVISTTPLPGVDLPLNEIAAPAQSLHQEDLRNSGALDLSDFLNRRLTNVHINEIQGNPFQPDVNYRGYTASPLLGTPQGISVYMDGVRLNQPFGEVVSWDLIPRIAISSTTLMPGSNPLFGLNTLGGALSIQTKNGLRDSGGSSGGLQATYGSHVRRALEFEYGGSNSKGWHWYFAGNRFGEHGWRTDSHTDVRQAFAKIGRQDAKNSVSLTVALANNSMNGNALQEQGLLARDYSSIYTRPDNTHNQSAFLNLEARRTVSSRLLLSGNVYYRDIQTRTLNADINEDSLDQSIYQPSTAEQDALANAGYTGFPQSGASAANTPFPFWRCIGNVLLNDEPGEQCNGLINRGRTGQHNFGLAGQFTLFGSTAGARRNQFTGGGAYDRSSVGFSQSTQLGYLNPDRSITSVDAFADGVTGGSVDGEPLDRRVHLNGVIHTWSLYATDTLSSGPWHITLSGRYNRTTIDNRDAIQPGGGPGSLDGNHAFHRLNPAAGVTYSPIDSVNLYFGYGEGSRAATSIELGCADPDQPCKLPNAMAGDPPLKQVVTRTWEAGIRSGDAGSLTSLRWLTGLTWRFGYFRADNHNDILFVTSTQSGFGYFKNFGRTKRQGIEVGVMREVLTKLNIGAGYTFLAATYASAETLTGSGNSTNDAGSGLEGVIQIEAGDRIPLTPRHMLKVSFDYQPIRRLTFDLNLVAVSRSFARGNENNLHESDGVYYLGPGSSAGYGVVNAGARFEIHRNLEVVAQLNNVFDKRYATAAQLGSTGFTGDATFIARPFPAIGGEFPLQQATFFAPGAPRMFSVATRVKF
jgi:outer membrane receptor protein involved in Fe transport